MGLPGFCCCGKCVVSLDVQALDNATMVPDYASTGWVHPYPRPNPDPETLCGYGYVEACGGGGQPLCGPIPRSEVPYGCTGDFTQDFNCYSRVGASGQKVSRRIRGHKAVQGLKFWHGRKPWNAPATCATGCPPETARYRSVSRRFDVLPGTHWEREVQDVTDGITYTFHWAASGSVGRDFTVGKDTGVLDLTQCDEDYTELLQDWPVPPFEPTPPSPGSPFLFLNDVKAFFSDVEVQAIVYGDVACDRLIYAIGGVGRTLPVGTSGAAEVFDDTSATHDLHEHLTWRAELSIGETGASYTYEVSGTQDFWSDHDAMLDPSKELIETGSGYLGYRFSWTLADAYAASALRDDVEWLLGRWDLMDHARLPFRMDGHLAAAPLVGRDEYQTCRDPDVGGVPCTLDVSGVPVPWYDVATCYYEPGVGACAWYTGAVWGAPASGLPDWSWDWANAVWWQCDNGSGLAPFRWSFGERNGATANATSNVVSQVMPAAATRWADNKAAGELLPGGWLHFDGCSLRAQKAAEVVEPGRVGADYCRPCGADRWRMDQDRAECVDSEWKVAESMPYDALLFTRDVTADWAVGELFTFYGPSMYENQVRPLSAIEYTGGITYAQFGATAAVPASLVAAVVASWWSDPTDPGQAGAFGVAGPLRWQEDGGLWRRGLCGAVLVSDASTGTPIVVTLAEATDLVDGDTVSVSGVGGATGANGTWTVGRVSASAFSLAGSTGGPPYTGGGDVRNGASGSLSGEPPDAAWCGHPHRGDLLFVQYLQDPDTGGVGASGQGTQLTVNGQCPVVAVTPNGESFAGGHVEPFPAATAFGPTVCGAWWSGRYVQEEVDPFWERPVSCDAAWSGCPPMVEARMEAPTGAPQFVAGIGFPPLSAPASAGWPAVIGIMVPVESYTAWNPCEAWV